MITKSKLLEQNTGDDIYYLGFPPLEKIKHFTLLHNPYDTYHFTKKLIFFPASYEAVDIPPDCLK